MADTTSMFDNTYTDQEGVVWDWDCAVCPRCRAKAKPEHYHFTTMTSFLCPECGVLYDEPHWEPAEAAFITCISDEESRTDPDPEIRRRYREYHGLSETTPCTGCGSTRMTDEVQAGVPCDVDECPSTFSPLDPAPEGWDGTAPLQ